MSNKIAPEAPEITVAMCYDTFRRGDYPGGAAEAVVAIRAVNQCTFQQALAVLDAGQEIQRLGLARLTPTAAIRWAHAVAIAAGVRP